MTTPEHLGYWYWINSIHGLGPLRIKRLLLLFNNQIEHIYNLNEEQLLSIKAIDEKIAQAFVKEKSKLENYKKIAFNNDERARSIEARILTLIDPEYPKVLLDTTACPAILYTRGNFDKVLSVNAWKSIAIVGTRKPSHHGIKAAEYLSRSFAEMGWAIVSGLAMGIDTCAHAGALASNGITVGVLGCGVDVVYPPSGQQLFDNIIKSGLLVSEYQFGIRPSDLNLKKRNKIIVGLSKAVIVIETGETGGTWNAVRAAIEQKKKVFALQPRDTSLPSVQGNIKLIKDGTGIPIDMDTGVNTILRELEGCP